MASAETPAAQSQRRGLLGSVLTTVAVGTAIAAAVWFLALRSSTATSTSLHLTATASGPPPAVGKPAPDFAVRNLDGTTVRLSDLRGHPVWLSFWATWCPPCREESPDMQAAYEAHQSDGLVVLAVDVGEDAGTVRGYVGRTGLTFAIGLDDTKEVASLYRIVGAPTHFFIDAQGVIRTIQIGAMGRKTMEKKIAAISSPSPEALAP